MTPKEKAVYLKQKLPRSALRFTNMRILEHEDNHPEKLYTKEYWEEVKKHIESNK